jgi:hypothetical protein
MSNANKICKHRLELTNLWAHNVSAVLENSIDRIINLRPDSILLRFEVDELHAACHT